MNHDDTNKATDTSTPASAAAGEAEQVTPAAVTVTFQARFRTAQRTKAPRTPSPAAQPRRQPQTQLAEHLALAHYVERCVADGKLTDYAEAARILRITRARMTQIMDLALLPADVQEAVLLGRLTSETEVRKLLIAQ